MYTKVPEIGWVKMDMETLAQSAGQLTTTDPSGLFNNFLPTEDIPLELYTVRSLGRDEVDGVETERLSLEVDFKEIWLHLSEEQRAQMRRELAAPAEGIDDLIEQIKLTNVELWIDDAGYNRRNKMRIVMGGLMTIDLDMHMFDFNSDISINPPESFQVLPQ